MDAELRIMLRKVSYYDLIIGIIVTAVLFFLCPSYFYVFFIGILVAGINFFLSGIINNYMLKGTTISRGFLIALLYIIRILMIGFIGAILYKFNNNNILFYMAGFCSHFISMIIYGFWANKQNYNK